ncbi:MAG: hypothetical protein COT74_10380 [Bdellovibrionales bacterium CG10_big_fil_rev_8_21_14_0_10_45_34]|nr:MAG: hypothetical protein COT74_10380 [Bdellovibrionales bacterium CG10_big_fil_rev_8_21_14_0_10_45_34]
MSTPLRDKNILFSSQGILQKVRATCTIGLILTFCVCTRAEVRATRALYIANALTKAGVNSSFCNKNDLPNYYPQLISVVHISSTEIAHNPKLYGVSDNFPQLLRNADLVLKIGATLQQTVLTENLPFLEKLDREFAATAEVLAGCGIRTNFEIRKYSGLEPSKVFDNGYRGEKFSSLNWRANLSPLAFERPHIFVVSELTDPDPSTAIRGFQSEQINGNAVNDGSPDTGIILLSQYRLSEGHKRKRCFDMAHELGHVLGRMSHVDSVTAPQKNKDLMTALCTDGKNKYFRLDRFSDAQCKLIRSHPVFAEQLSSRNDSQ